MMRGIIFGDSLYEEPRTSIARTNGGHRIATLLRKQGIEVEVIDFFNSWTIQELERIVDVSSLTFLGLSLGLGQLDQTKTNHIIAYAKERNPNIKIIVGGAHALTEEFDGIDLYFRGFADGAITDLVAYLKTGVYREETTEVTSFPRTKNIVNCNKHYSVFDLANLRTEYSATDFLTSNENIGLETSRGCIFKCKFCNFPLIGKKKNDYIRSKDDLKEEIIHNYNTWGISNYSVTDDTFNDNELKVDILYEIAQEVDFDLSFMGYIRVDLLRARPGSLDKLVKAGFKGMHFGIETLTVETSKTIGKGFSGEPLKEYLREIKGAYPNLNITGSFIIGLPNESLEQAEANIRSVVEERLIDSIPLFPLTIPKKSDTNADLSDFSLSWEKHEYEEISIDEAKKIVEKPEYAMFRGLDLEIQGATEVLWKNAHMNIFDAALAAEKLKRELHAVTNISGWHCFAASCTDSKVDQRLGFKRPDWDWNALKANTFHFTEEYKQKKILAIESMWS